MLNVVQEIIQKTLDTLAPAPPLSEDFRYQWNRLMQHYMDLKFEDKTAIEETCFPDCLNRLSNILINEDHLLGGSTEGFNVEIGSCMEYLFKHNLLDMLVTTAIIDIPIGMKLNVLKFFSKMLSHLKEPVVAHSTVHIPLIKLMNICDGLLHSVYEIDEIEFLFNLSAILCKQSAVALLFFSEDSMKNQIRLTKEIENFKFEGILDLVLTYVDSADSQVRVRACQSILLLCSMRDELIADIIVNNFKLNHFVIGRLATLFNEISSENFEYIKNIDPNWTLDQPINFEAHDNAEWEGVVFLNWLDYINQLTLESHILIQNSLQKSLTMTFLEEFFTVESLCYPKTVAVFYKYYHTIASDVLIDGFHEWLSAKEYSYTIDDVANAVLPTLIDNCTCQNKFVAITSLQFFNDLLKRCDERILKCSIFFFLSNRSYYDFTTSASSWSDEEDERQKYSNSFETLSSSRTLAPSNIDKIVQCFTNMMSTDVNLQNNDDIQRLKNQYQNLLEHCAKYKWPTEAVFDLEEDDSFSEYFHEGPFLHMIFSKLKNFVNLDYIQASLTVNIIIKLALIPHPFLHEYLLNPLLPLRKNVDSLYRILQHTINDLASKVKNISDYGKKLQYTKDTIQINSHCNNVNNEENKYLELYVLLEELCNNLAIIAYVKYVCAH